MKKIPLKRTGLKRKAKKVKIVKPFLMIKKSVPQSKKECWKAFSQFIRIRDCLRTTGTIAYGLCISCGKKFSYGELQAGHLVAGRHNANLFYERGCFAQCRGCNVFLHGNVLNYMDSIVRLYGIEAIAEIRENDKQAVRFNVIDLEEKKKYYLGKTKLLIEGACC